MSFIEQIIDLDLSLSLDKIVAILQQGEKSGRTYYFRIKNNKQDFDGTGYDIRIQVDKPDGTTVIRESTDEESGLTIDQYSPLIVKFVPDKNITAVEAKAIYCKLSILDGENIIKTTLFKFRIEGGTKPEEEILSSNEYKRLDDMLKAFDEDGTSKIMSRLSEIENAIQKIEQETPKVYDAWCESNGDSAEKIINIRDISPSIDGSEEFIAGSVVAVNFVNKNTCTYGDIILKIYKENEYVRGYSIRNNSELPYYDIVKGYNYFFIEPGNNVLYPIYTYSDISRLENRIENLQQQIDKLQNIKGYSSATLSVSRSQDINIVATCTVEKEA